MTVYLSVESKVDSHCGPIQHCRPVELLGKSHSQVRFVRSFNRVLLHVDAPKCDEIYGKTLVVIVPDVEFIPPELVVL